MGNRQDSRIWHFNPRSHKGSDDVGGFQAGIVGISIHAPTRGATYIGSRYPGGRGHFNPRSHKGSDQDMEKCDYQCKISIHAPTRGATTSVAGIPEVEGISIHAPTRGATPKFRNGVQTDEFQSTLPQGERL